MGKRHIEGALPLAAMEKIIKSVNPSIRVSDKSKMALKKALESLAVKIASKSISNARHAGRKTVTHDDIDLAVEPLRNLVF